MKKSKLFSFFLIVCFCVFFATECYAKKTCEPFSQRLREMQSCILCPVFKVILSTDQTMASMSYNALAADFRNVIIVVMALFIAYQTLLSVSAFTKQDVGKYLQTIAVQAFKVLIAALFLTKSIYAYEYIINPLMQAGLEFGLTIIDSQAAQQLTLHAANWEKQMPSGVMSQNLLAQVQGTVQLFSESAAHLPAIGRCLMCGAFAAKGILPDISLLIEGAVAYIFGWAIALSCCFYLLDSVVRFGIFCTLLPFLIACWPFKITFKYTKAGWDIFMNSFFNFVMMGLIISLTSELATQSLTGGTMTKDQLEDWLEHLNDQDGFTQLAKDMSLDGTKFLVMVACCIFAFKLVAQVGELANSISGTQGPADGGIGGKIGGLAAQTAKSAAGTGLKAAGKVTGVTGAVQGLKDRINARSDSIRKGVAGAGKDKSGAGDSGGSGGGSDSGGGGSGGGGGGSGSAGDSGDGS